MTERDIDKVVEDICECPTCEAVKGEQCFDDRGNLCRPHGARMTMALGDQIAEARNA